MGEMEESWEFFLIEGPTSKRVKRAIASPQTQPAAPSAATLSSVSRALIQLTLRHESQLRALAMEDQYILFLQADERGVLPLLFRASTQWRDNQLKGQHTMALLTHLFHVVTQELESDAGQAPGRTLAGTVANLLTEQGGWNYTQYNQQKKALAPMSDKTPISMGKMKQWVMELHKLAPLKRQTTSPSADSISPWLLQVSGCTNQLWELLTTLSHYSSAD